MKLSNMTANEAVELAGQVDALRAANQQIAHLRQDNAEFAGTAAAPTYDYDEEPFCVDAGEWMPGAWGHYPKRMIGGA